MTTTIKDRDFLTKKQKKLLISDSFLNAESLIKRFVLLNEVPVLNVEKETLESLATRIYRIIGDANKAVINDDDAIFIIDSLLRKNKYSFLKEKSFGLSTAKAFFGVIKEIKYGFLNENKKTHWTNFDLILLQDYNDYLKNNNLIDTADVMSFANDNVSEEILAYSSDVIVGVTNNLNGHLRYLELCFLKKICQIYHQDILYIDYSLQDQNIIKHKVNAHGFINEIKFIVDDIRDNKYNLSDINVFISGSSYESMIKALFDYYGINYHFISGESISLFPINSVINYALSFVDHFCELKSIYNLLLTNVIKEEFKDIIPVLTKLKCDHVNIAFYKEKLDENLAQFLTLLLDIDDDSCSISDLFNRLIKFLQFACKEECYLLFDNSFKEIQEHLKYVDEISCPNIHKKIEIIKSFVSSIRLQKEKEDASVNIVPLRACFLINRKYNYLVGLSASQLSVKEIQSPVLNDEELSKLLKHDDCYISLAKNNNEEYMQSIYSFINTASNDTSITYIYSSYESAAFQMQAPSTLYVDVPGKEDKKEYELDKGALTKDEIKSSSVAKKIEKLSFSPSALETFVKCPCQYLLQYVEDYGKIDIATYSNTWFQGGEFGTFCHLVLEKYFKVNNTRDKQRVFDEISYQNCLKLAIEETKALQPFGNQKTIKVETQRAGRIVENYLRNYFKDTEGYFVVACEYDFTNDEVSEIFEIKDKSAVVSYYGKIDRIDVKADIDGTLHIRTIDYKTTARSKMVTKVNKGETFQGHIYAIAAKNYCLKYKNKIEKLLKQKLSYEKVDDLTNIVFEYVFPLEKGTNAILEVKLENEAASIDKLRALISTIMEYNGDLNVQGTLINMNKTLAKVTEMQKGDCQYCSMVRHCRYRIANGENLYPVTAKETKEEDA